MSLSHIATDVGDLSCITAVAGLVFFWCWIWVGRLSAVLFAMTYVAVVMTVAGLKLISADVFELPRPDQVAWLEPSRGAPSGHAAMSVFVYGAVAYLCTRARQPWLRALGPLACAAVVAVVAVTRVTLHKHTVADVVAGFSVGGVLVIGLIWILRRQPQTRAAPVGWLLTGLIAVNGLMLMSGLRVDNDFGFF